jgi:hypothetical protein
MKIIMNKVGMRSVTIRAILTQVTLLSTCVANAAFGTPRLGIHLLALSGLAWRLLA